MKKIDEQWPEGIRRFWAKFDRLDDLGDESGFDLEKGRLVICRCYNRQLDENILREKQYIRELVIKKNELKRESYDIIAQLSNLRKLVLESVGFNIQEFDVEELKHLTDVIIGSASNTDVPRWIFRLENLESLNISNTRIERFPDYRGYTGYKKWKKLDISYTAIEMLPDFRESKLLQLRELRVANTEIESIPSCYLTGALRLLDCSNTRISSFDGFEQAENLEVFRCADNEFITDLKGLSVDKLRVLDVCHCTKLESLPEQKYDKIEVLAVCGDFFDALPKELLKHCIEQKISFKQERASKLRELHYDNMGTLGIPKNMKGVYIEETFFREMDFRYLLYNDPTFLSDYIAMDEMGGLCAKHEAKIMILGDESGVGDVFLQSLLPEYPKLYYMEYGGLKVLDASGGELDYIRQKLDYDVDLSIWTMENGVDEQFMHQILFSDHDFYVIVLKEGEEVNYYQRAAYWIKEIARCVQYATIAFAVVGSRKDVAVLSVREVKQECKRKYFRFLNQVYNVNINDSEENIELTEWLVEGIKEKSNYEMKILPEWKRLRGEIVSYLDLRRIINQERFESLLILERASERDAFVNYLRESKSLFHIRYSEEESYYFKAEWVISALFALLHILRNNVLPDSFGMDDLRTYLQIEKIAPLDFFQDSKSLGYLLAILEETGAVFHNGKRYYRLIALPHIAVESGLYRAMKNPELVRYKITYSILTEQMILKMKAVLLSKWRGEFDNIVFQYRNCIAFKAGKGKNKGYLVVRMIMGCPGEVQVYSLADTVTGRVPSSVELTLRSGLQRFLRILKYERFAALWQSETFSYYVANGIGDFISMETVESYVRAGYASAFMAQYNTLIDMDELYGEYGIDI